MRAARMLTRPENVLRLQAKLCRLGAASAPVAPVRRTNHQRTHAAALGRLVHGSQATVAEPEQQGSATRTAPSRKRQKLQQGPKLGARRSPTSELTPPHVHRPAGSGPAARAGSTRSRQLAELETFLGYRFRDLTLLDQACTHDSSSSLPSYRELAFVGDAALWLLFAEHAFRTYGAHEDPISGGWPALLSKLLSRASCAGTARQWGLDTFLQHSTPRPPRPRTHPHNNQLQSLTLQPKQPQQRRGESQFSSPWCVEDPLDSPGSSAAVQPGTSSDSSCSSRLDRTDSNISTAGSRSSSSSSSSTGRSGMYAGVWTSDSLAEMFEGLVGALLLDCEADLQALKQLLLPWVAASFDTAKNTAATAAAAAPAAGGVAVGSPSASSSAAGAASMQQGFQGQEQLLQLLTAGAAPSCGVVALSAPWPTAADITQQAGGQQSVLKRQYQHQLLQSALLHQLGVVCSHRVNTEQPLCAASSLMVQLMQCGVCAAQAETLRFLGFGVLQFTAALQAYCLQHAGREIAGCLPWLTQPAHGLQQADSGEARPWNSSSISSDGSSSNTDLDSSDFSSGVSSLSAAPPINIVHRMSKHASELTTVRHRAKMWLLLLEGTPWCSEDSYLVNSSWKKQKQTLSCCLDLLLAAVYLDSGLEAAVGVAAVLIRHTPPTTHDKSWMPAWARQNK